MVTLTETREGVMAAVDSFTKLTGMAGLTLQDSTVPHWARSIKEIGITAGIDGAAVCGVVGCKFAGATTHGDQIIYGLAHGNIGTTVGLAAADCVLPVDFGVTPGKNLEVYGVLAGGDSGSPEVGVTFTYSSAPAGHSYISREALCATADTFNELNTENGTTTVNSPMTQGKAIDQVLTMAGYGSTTQEPQVAYVRVRGVGGSIEGNEHTFGCTSYVVSDGTLADTFMSKCNIHNVDIPVRPGAMIIEGVSSGATVTTDPEVACTVAFRL